MKYFGHPTFWPPSSRSKLSPFPWVSNWQCWVLRWYAGWRGGPWHCAALCGTVRGTMAPTRERKLCLQHSGSGARPCRTSSTLLKHCRDLFRSQRSLGRAPGFSTLIRSSLDYSANYDSCAEAGHARAKNSTNPAEQAKSKSHKETKWMKTVLPST